MAFRICTLDESEKREYTLTMFPRYGEKLRPDGGIIDSENDIRLFYYGNGPFREPCSEFQFIFDYKGVAMNINIFEKIKESCSWIGEIYSYPGELEQEALASEVFKALKGERQILKYEGKPVFEGFEFLKD